MEQTLISSQSLETPTLRIGIDLGGTKIEAVGLDLHGAVRVRHRIPTPRGDYDGTIRALADLARSIETGLQITATVGVGIPGTIVRSTGLVKNANSIWLNGRPLAQDLSYALGREVRVANDANCFAVSEAWDGAAAGKNVVFGVIVGTGCGGGLVFHNQLHAGNNGLAGEWGHNPLPWATAAELPGPACYCGKHGCLETWISGTGLMRDFNTHESRSVGAPPLTGPEIVALSECGDPHAIAAMDRLEDRMARSLAEIMNILDPDAVVLGGGLSQIPRLYQTLPARIQPYTFGAADKILILSPLHGDASGVRGAAWLWNE
jgi:fructokinase